MNRDSLSGAWTGYYAYPGSADMTPFLLSLTHSGGLIDGMIEEPDNYGYFGVDVVYSVFSGETAGDAVTFVKTIENVQGKPSITYVGTVNADRTQIDGQWVILGAWSGQFYMRRDLPAETVSVELEAEARR